jgi:tellurite resistance protein TerC
MFTSAQLLEALPVIAMLILIEGLLSVDNALAIAAMASHLPGKQKLMALRLGIIGAYAFRGLALALASWIIENEWVKWFGAAYLVYLMCSHLTQPKDDDGDPLKVKKKPGLFMTIVQIELMDLSLSVDNVVAAVALAPKNPVTGKEEMWVVYVGVFIGILALRLLAGYSLKMLQKYPVLAHTAFILVGYVGFILIAELMFHFHVHSWEKFIGVVIITSLTILYEKHTFVQTILGPVVKIAYPIMRGFAVILDTVFWPLRKLHEILARRFQKPVTEEDRLREETMP